MGFMLEKTPFLSPELCLREQPPPIRGLGSSQRHQMSCVMCKKKRKKRKENVSDDSNEGHYFTSKSMKLHK